MARRCAYASRTQSPTPTRHDSRQWWNENTNGTGDHRGYERRLSSRLAVQLHRLGRSGFDPDLTALGVPDAPLGTLRHPLVQQLPNRANTLR